MAVRRKIFRIEEGARARAGAAPSAGEANDAPQHHDFIAEIKALRALIEPRAEVNREAIERSRAQIVQAQAYKHELDLIYAAVKRTKQEMDKIGVDAFSPADVERAGEELQAIVAGTEHATQAVLQAAEDIDQNANTLSASLKRGHEQGLAHDIRERVVQIYEACNFQDLTGQRVTKVVATLKFIEEHVGRLMEIWHGIEQLKPITLDEIEGKDRRLLNGPKLAGESGHSSQDDIDTMFGAAGAS